MELTELIHPGMTNEETFVIVEKYLASHVGSGSLRVLATPWLISFMEGVSHRLLAKHLPEGYSSVGMHIDMRHLAPTPVGDTVRVQTEVLSVDGWTVAFAVRAWDTKEQIGECRHERFVIDVERFLKRVEKKASHPSPFLGVEWGGGMGGGIC
jgi:fluoroacetyl-CoA thioesterase